MARENPTTRRLFLRSAAAVPALGLPSLATATPADPIFAAIEAHREADAAFCASLKGRAIIEDERLAEARSDVLGDIETATRETMLATAPTTVAGLLALIRHIRGSEDNLGYQYLYEEDIGQFLETIETACAGMEAAS